MGYKASTPRIQLGLGMKHARAAMLARPRYRIAGNPTGELRTEGSWGRWARRIGQVAKRVMGKRRLRSGGKNWRAWLCADCTRHVHVYIIYIGPVTCMAGTVEGEGLAWNVM